MPPRTKSTDEPVTIRRANMQTVEVTVVGTAPLVIHAFGAKAVHQMIANQEAGSKAKGKKNLAPKDFEAQFEEATHRSTEGWYGVPAGALRSAMIDACRLCGVVMARAKLAIFIVADGFDSVDGAPLVRIYGDRGRLDAPLRNANGGMDVRARPQWKRWCLKLRIRFDADQFDTSSVLNLLARAGEQVGIGEGRPNSRQSTGVGWGTFCLQESVELEEAAE